MPRRGSVVEPRVAASATLGKKSKRIQPQRGCEILINMPHLSATALRLKHKIGRVPRVAQSGNPGLKDAAPSGQP